MPQPAVLKPNPSLKRSVNGRPSGPGLWYAAHFHRPGPGLASCRCRPLSLREGQGIYLDNIYVPEAVSMDRHKHP